MNYLKDKLEADFVSLVFFFERVIASRMINRLKQPGILNWPNLITIARIVSIPIVLLIMSWLDDGNLAQLAENQFLSSFAAFLFVIAMFSDLLDGYLARRYNIISTFGKFLDPLADKLMSLTVMVMLVALHRMPAWLVNVLLVREVAITTLRSVAVDEGIIIGASKGAKYKSAFTSAAMFALLMHYDTWGIHWRAMGWFMMIPATWLSIQSGVVYCIDFYRSYRLKNKA